MTSPAARTAPASGAAAPAPVTPAPAAPAPVTPAPAAPAPFTPAPAAPALVVRAPGDVALETRAAPSAAAGDLLARPDLIGLCGTDLEIIDGAVDPAYLRYPVVLGHEWTGTAGGRRIVAEGVIGCMHCARCAAGQTNLCETYDEIGFTRDGAAAGAIAVPAAGVHYTDPGVTPEGAVLAEPAAVVYQALRRARPEPGIRALVIGDGTVALLAARMLRLWSPAQVVLLGRRPAQAELAAQAGADRFETADAAAGSGYDLVLEAAGTTSAAAAAIAAVRRGGTVVLVGLPPHGATVPLSVDDAVNNDLTILGSFSYTAAAFGSVVTLLNAGQLKPGFLVTHRFPLTAWQDAIATLRGTDGPRGKILLQPGA
jgi:threonine dehydrogenase-like Zn-dependent dehydrogenase